MRKILLATVLILALMYALVYMAFYTRTNFACASYGVHTIRVDVDFEGFCRYQLSTGRIIDRPLSYYVIHYSEE